MVWGFFLLGGGVLLKYVEFVVGVMISVEVGLWLDMINYGEMKFIVMGVWSDMLSGMLVMLSIWVLLLVFLVRGVWIEFFSKGLVFSISLLLMLCFVMSNLFSFYIFFELVLIPMFLLVVFYGGYGERLESGFYMLFYTSLGSLPLLMMMMKGFNSSWSMIYIKYMSGWKVMGIGVVMMLLGFFVKLPLYGVHIWLLKVHVEAPVIGSMILAGVLLKLGGYGVLRVIYFLEMGFLLEMLIVMMGLLGGLYCGVACLRQSDMKKLVAYSSVVHMGMGVAGGIVCNLEGSMGMIMMLMSHGFCSSGLFFFVDLLYKRGYSRSVIVSKGCLGLCVGLMLWCFLLVVVNMSAPPFLSFFSEVLLLMGLLKVDDFLSVILMFLLFMTVCYMIYFYSMMAHGKESLISFKPILVMEYLVLVLHFIPVGLLIFVMDVNVVFV